MSQGFLPIARPDLGGNEVAYVRDCVESTWVSSSGKYIDAFEGRFAEFCETTHAVGCSNGTVALHLALLALGIGPGDEVIVPTLTYVAAANAVLYVGATPVLVDSAPGDWNLDPDQVAQAVTERTRAIVVVHLYGCPADMRRIMSLADAHGLHVIEDAAEAHGARYDGVPVGSIGDVGTFSFYGNKVLTTGEGGMVVTNDDNVAARVRQLKGQGQDPDRRYRFPVVGFNYRMTNIQAALGLAQLERAGEMMERRFRIGSWYRQRLEDRDHIHFQVPVRGAQAIDWLVTVTIAGVDEAGRDRIMAEMTDHGVETRPVFYPMHTMPAFGSTRHGPRAGRGFPVAERIAAAGISLPTWSGLTEADVDRVCARLLAAAAV